MRGPLLPEEDAAWIQDARAWLARTVLRIRLSAAEAALAVGDPVGARFTAEQALQEEPYDEAALRLLMRALTAAGNGAAALAAYARFRTRLRTELGVDPSGETDALHLVVLTHSSPLRDSRRGVHFVGRSHELRQLDYVLQTAVAGGASAVVVQAAPGTGKSALSAQWARSPAVTQAFCVMGRCDELGRDLPLQPVMTASCGTSGRPTPIPQRGSAPTPLCWRRCSGTRSRARAVAKRASATSNATAQAA